MDYVFAGITALFCAVLAYLILDENKAKKIKILHALGHGEAYENIKIGASTYWFLVIVVTALSGATAFRISTQVPETLNIVKMSITLICLTGAMCNDLLEHRIPNIFPIVIALGGLACLAVGYFIDQQGAQAYIVSSMVATIGSAICFSFAYFISRHGIGLGDIKLICAVALMAGVYLTCGMLFFGMVSCAVLSILFLILRKKKLKDALPFGPFLYLGFIVSIWMSIF